MKKNNILFTCIFSVFLLTLTPLIPTVECTTIVDSWKSHQIKSLNSLHIPTYGFTRLKQVLVRDNFVDFPLLLSIVNIIIFRLSLGFPMTMKTMMTNIPIIVILLGLILLVQQEYSTNLKIPRYKVYQMYFMSLFSIIVALEVKMLPATFPRAQLTVVMLSLMILMLLGRYLGNILYVALGRPS